MEYKPPSLLFNNHLETIYPSLFRKVDIEHSLAEKILTPDSDFLELKWYHNNSNKLVIISHGLEGNYDRAYVKGMVRVFKNAKIDVLTWCYRGCGSEINKQKRFYHSGATDDLDTIVQYAMTKSYGSINFVGFSLGGNITLKYLGEQSSKENINKAVAISVPLNLGTSCDVIDTPSNWVYSNRFLRSLKKKVLAKSVQFEIQNLDKIDKVKSIRQFDELFTGPLHGFSGAQDYYDKCSSIHFIDRIKNSTLILNALNDPFLSSDCYPTEINKEHISYLYPKHGGHVGFTLFNKKNLYWSELMALDFITS